MSTPENSSNEIETENQPTCSTRWSRGVKSLTDPILRLILATSRHAAAHPKSYVISIPIVSIALIMIGFSTNFTQITSDEVWTPQNSKPVQHGRWIENESGFPKDSRGTMLIVHAEGKNIFGEDGSSMAMEGVERVFEAIDLVKKIPGYDELCSKSNFIDPIDNKTTCEISGVSSFWNDSSDIFKQSVSSDEEVIQSLSQKFYPNGAQVQHDVIIGYNIFNSDTLTSGLSFINVITFPGGNAEEEAIEVEGLMIDRLKDLQNKWSDNDGYNFRVEFQTARSFDDEFSRALGKDLPLLPMVFALMSVLCVFIFHNKDKVLSRKWLGFGAVVTVLLAIIASFGLLFICAVPFTSLTPILPFIMFGVGLDDAFIIYGSYIRTSHTKTPEERIDTTIHDIGATILLTTLTAAVAFALGLVSSIPAVRYLVLYAFPTIIIDFIFQITFFVALIVLDERRIEANRKDCCFCCTSGEAIQVEERYSSENGDGNKHFADRAMAKFGKWLLTRRVSVAVVFLFAGMLGFFTWSTCQLEQFFDFTDVIPDDSYIQGWWDAFNDYYEANGVRAGVYFRDVDFSDASIQSQMKSYLQELADLRYTAGYPFKFWLEDFEKFIANSDDLVNKSFEEQLDAFLAEPIYFDSYNTHIVRDADGVITSSRTYIRLDNVDYADVKEVVSYVNAQRKITSNLEINQGLDDWAFFTWTDDYYIWEFYRVSPKEFATTTITGVVSVSFLALLFIPHWSATLYVGSMMMILYVDLLGFIQICGISINPVTYIACVMSIGLMVDYVMHVTTRYMELTSSDRKQRTEETLETIGASLLVGGISTLLGVVPLAFSSSEIFFTVFVVFFGLVLLGMMHGLMLLPVILSVVGPLDSISQTINVHQKVTEFPDEMDKTHQMDAIEDLSRHQENA